MIRPEYDGFNPGPGPPCEGEDWVAISGDESTDVATAHVYARQMGETPTRWETRASGTPPPAWWTCDWSCFMSFYKTYIDRHTTVATETLGKPLVIEEMNLDLPKHSAEQRAAFFQLALDQVLWSKATGGPLMGVMFWTAAIGSSVWDDGYAIYLDVWLPTTPSPGDNASGAPAAGPPMERGPLYINTEGLDRFRRGAQREACVDETSKAWLPSWSSGAVSSQFYLDTTAGKLVQQVIKDAAAALNA
ncbi:hypothetical protein FOA52_005458 [Chlamydomonas sp. UWO 241]|nr:hypothetical protein FOA52_005458 [Chlamydomonas sp. UWO 241]